MNSLQDTPREQIPSDLPEISYPPLEPSAASARIVKRSAWIAFVPRFSLATLLLACMLCALAVMLSVQNIRHAEELLVQQREVERLRELASSDPKLLERVLAFPLLDKIGSVQLTQRWRQSETTSLYTQVVILDPRKSYVVYGKNPRPFRPSPGALNQPVIIPAAKSKNERSLLVIEAVFRGEHAIERDSPHAFVGAVKFSLTHHDSKQSTSYALVSLDQMTLPKNPIVGDFSRHFLSNAQFQPGQDIELFWVKNWEIGNPQIEEFGIWIEEEQPTPPAARPIKSSNPWRGN